MSIWKHIFCMTYGVSFALLFLFAILNLTSLIHIEWSKFGTPIHIFTIGISAFLLSAIRTKDFWKDDPDSIRSLKKKESKTKVEHMAEVLKINVSNDEKNAKLLESIDRLKQANAKYEKELTIWRSGKRPAPRAIHEK